MNKVKVVQVVCHDLYDGLILDDVYFERDLERDLNVPIPTPGVDNVSICPDGSIVISTRW